LPSLDPKFDYRLVHQDNLKWLTVNCSAEDWQYVMDMPALYSLVRQAGQEYDVLLQEQSHSSRVGLHRPHTHVWLYILRPRFQESLELIKLLKMGILLRTLILTTSGFLWELDRVSEIKLKHLSRLWNLHSQSKLWCTWRIRGLITVFSSLSSQSLCINF
jgi:hypothetical protein